MIMIKINDCIVDRFQADGSEWAGQIDADLLSSNVLKIEHYGKNYITDQNPDKYFELTKVYINEVDLKHHIYNFKQTAYLPPWDLVEPPDHSFYLGHNGYLSVKFNSPVNLWLRQLFGLTDETMHGQQTTQAVLDSVKKYFDMP
jgi:hypothetical protein